MNLVFAHFATILILTLFFTTPALALTSFDQTTSQITPEAAKNEYYTLDETAPADLSTEFIEPEILAEEFANWSQQALANSDISLVKWILHKTAPPQATDPYKRRAHFGGWMRDPSTNSCYSVRALVLMRDSLDPVTYSANNHCVVESGTWKDPYTGATLTDAKKQIQIDHLVPLKNAYISGAWTWTPVQRCTYANFMGSKYHLISAEAHENMKKGDRPPGQYLPPDRSYSCQYISNWLKVKLGWNLLMSAEEGDDIAQLLTQNNCPSSILHMSKNELRTIRNEMQNPRGCANFKGGSTLGTPSN